MRVISIKIDEDLLQKIDETAIINGMSRSEFLRKAAELYLKLMEYKVEPPRYVRLLN